MKALPFDFADTCRYLPHFSAEDKALAYGMVGGTPQYLLQLNDRASIEQNIKNTFLNPTSALFEEPENLLKQEVREPGLYNAIITAIANGASRMSQISAKVGEDASVCAGYLKNLVALGLVQKETTYGEKAPHRSVYAIQDNMFRFWYRFVPQNYSLVGLGAAVLETLVKRSRMFRYDRVQLYLFAKNGFTPHCVQQAQQLGNVALVTYSNILQLILAE